MAYLKIDGDKKDVTGLWVKEKLATRLKFHKAMTWDVPSVSSPNLKSRNGRIIL